MAVSEICPRDLCTGCSACASACGTGAISMKADRFGFLHPAIDGSLCVDCGRCTKVCPVNTPVKRGEPRTVYALHAANPAVRKSSASGGAAGACALKVIEEGGAVYGCVQHNCLDIRHERITDADGARNAGGSKYVQSAIGECFRQCRKDLSEGRKVLFTGTPCQVAGLKNYLGRDYPNLLTIDLVCHGVPSRLFLKENIKKLSSEGKLKGDARELKVEFRKKGKEGLEYGFYLGDYREAFPKDDYIAGFISGLFCRESCFSCPYASPARVGDLTIGDFWGLGKEKPSCMRVSEGVSEVLVNTEKGMQLVESLAGIEKEKRDVREALEGNRALKRPMALPKDFGKFRELYASSGYAAACAATLPAYRRGLKRKKLKEAVVELPVLGKVLRMIFSRRRK